MEHEIVAEQDGVVTELAVTTGQTVSEGQVLVVLQPGSGPTASDREAGTHNPVQAPERSDLHTVHERHDIGLDHRRPDAVAKRHEQGRRTARENLTDLLDPDTFVEYGPLMYGAQEQRRPQQELIERTPADGLVGGVGATGSAPGDGRRQFQGAAVHRRLADLGVRGDGPGGRGQARHAPGAGRDR